MPNTAYRLWYEYLRETEPSTWSASVRKDFAGVLDQDFEEWFEAVKFDLFLDTFKRPATEFPVWSIDRDDYESDKDYLLEVLGEKPKDDDKEDFSRIFAELEHIADLDERIEEAVYRYQAKVEAEFERKQHLVLVVNLSYAMRHVKAKRLQQVFEIQVCVHVIAYSGRLVPECTETVFRSCKKQREASCRDDGVTVPYTYPIP